MYFVDRKAIMHQLDYLNRLIAVFPGGSWQSLTGKLALERLAQNTIESMIDVGNKMIDGFIMRDPGGYEDIIDILDDESVLPHDDAESLRKVVDLRRMLVQHYSEVDHTQLEKVISENINALKDFSGHITVYLEKELGPVSAFTPETHKDN
jgi:Uncharacterized conserved protein